MSDFQQHYKQSTDNRTEGDVTIEKKSNKKEPTKNLEGDYVEFEEFE